MGGKNYKIVGLYLLMLLVAACVKDKPATPANPDSTDTANRVYIVCEGSLGNGNSSLGMYDVKTGQFYDDVYKAANGQDVGDVLQSVTEINGRLFLCVNNSDKILVINKADHKLVGNIAIPKPRYILPVSATKAYVSTIFSPTVYIINPQTLTSTGSFAIPAQNPEGMLLHNGSLYVCGWDTVSDKVFRIDTGTNAIAQQIKIAGRAPQHVLEDKNNNLWVLSGNVYKGKQAALTCINDIDGSIIRSFQFAPKAEAIKPVFNTTRDILYFIEVNYSGGTENNGIYKIPIDATSIPLTPLIPAKEFQYFWALGIEPATGNLYIGDPKGFIQKGAVQVYTPNGNFVKEWGTGVGPGHFYFQK